MKTKPEPNWRPPCRRACRCARLRPACRCRKTRSKAPSKGLAFVFWLNIVLAVFMIFNTFLMNVGERRRQLSILRAIGTTRKQIMRMLILEGFAMGVTGTVLGMVLGIVGAHLLTAGMMRVYSNSIPPLLITPGPFILASIIGPMLSLCGVIVPSYLAGKITPLEGIRPIVDEHERHIPLSFVIMAVAVFVTTGSLLTGSIMGYLPLALLPIFGVIFTAAFVMLVPIVLKAMSKGTATLLYPLLKVEGQLASRQILRRRARATLTIGILYVAVSMAVSLGITLVNNVNDVRGWFDRTISGDFIVRATASELSAGSPVHMPETLGEEIRHLDGVRNVDIMSFIKVTAGDMPIQLCARGFTDKDTLPLVLKQGSAENVRRALDQGEVVVGDVVANRLGKKIGDDLVLTTPKGDITVPHCGHRHRLHQRRPGGVYGA